jgi:hypothetical protein
MIAADDKTYLIANGEAWLWSFAGYSRFPTAPEEAKLLTPPSIVNALHAGYRPDIHVSASVAA